MKPKSVLMGLVVGFALTSSAQAVIKIDFDLRDLGRMSAQSLVGKVTAIDTETNVVTVEIEKDFKKRPFEKVAKIDLSVAPAFVKGIGVGRPIVFLTSRVRGAMIHLGDALCTAEEKPVGDPPTWKVDKKHDAWLTFPGQTEGLIQCLEDHAAGKYRLLSGMRHRIGTNWREVMDLGSKAVFLACPDVNGDGLPDLLVGLPTGAKLFLTVKPGYEELELKDVTDAWGLSGLKGKLAAFGDVNADGKTDLLVDGTLFVNAGSAFERTDAVPSMPEVADLAAVGLIDVTGDGKADALFLTRNGQYRCVPSAGATDKPWTPAAPVSLWDPAVVKPGEENPKFKVTAPVDGKALAAIFGQWGANDSIYAMVVRVDGVFRFPLDPRDGRPSDFVQLTGDLSKGGTPADLSTMVAVTRVRLEALYPDSFYIVCSPYPDLGLCNRMYGCYLPNTKLGDWRAMTKAGKWGSKENFTVTAIAAGDFNRQDQYDELVFVTTDGKLCMQDNDNGVKGALARQARGMAPAGASATSQPAD